MEDILKNLTDTELLKLVNDATSKHEQVKIELLAILDKYDQKLNELKELEDEYVDLIAEITKRSENVRETTLN